MFCSNCGNETADILRSCPRCGAPTTIPNSNKENDKQEYRQLKKDNYQNLKDRVERYKPMWDKDGVIQFKSDNIAILQKLGSQVEFIIAFEDLTKEGYELKGIDLAKESSSFSDGVDFFYYFQKFNS